MKPYLTCAVMALVLAAPAAHAGLFGKDKNEKDEAAAAMPGVPGGAGFTNMPQEAAPEPARAATEQEIQAVLRSDPLTQSAFFSTQYDRDPTNARMGLYLSNALRAMGRYREAAETAHRVLLFAPKDTEVLIAAARAHIGGNDAFNAVDPLRQVTELKPRDWQAWSLLGVAYEQVKRPEDAQAAWAKALELSPDNPSVLSNIAMAKVAQGDFAAAEPLLRTAVAQEGATLQVRQNLALVLGVQGHMAEAERLLRADLPPEQADASLEWLRQAMTARLASAPGPATRSWESVKAAGGR